MSEQNLTSEPSHDMIDTDMVNRSVTKKTPGPIYIALSGKKQTGKDTAASMIVGILDECGKKVCLTAFAEPLKNMCIDVLGLDRALVYGSNEDKETPTHISWNRMPDDIRLKYSTTFEQEFGFAYDKSSGYPEGYVKAIRQAKRRLMRSGPMTVREVLQIAGTDIFREMFWDNVWAESPFIKDVGDVDAVVMTDCRFPNEKNCTEENGGVIIRLERSTGFNDSHKSETALDDYTFKYLYQNSGSLKDLEDFLRTTLKEVGLIE